jgi:hypothetical protein
MEVEKDFYRAVRKTTGTASDVGLRAHLKKKFGNRAKPVFPFTQRRRFPPANAGLSTLTGNLVSPALPPRRTCDRSIRNGKRLGRLVDGALIGGAGGQVEKNGGSHRE